MKKYDFVIVGGGASGLSLACHLAESPLRDSSILVLDRSCKEGNDHAWAFWAKGRTPFDAVAYHSWHRLLIATNGEEQVHELGTYRYKAIHGEDFYRFAHEKLSSLPNIEFVQGKVERIEDRPEGARLFVSGHKDGGEIEGGWVFDSRFNLASFQPDPERFCYLRMQFRGWEVVTEDPCFDPQTPTFLDLRTPQKGRMCFFYVLPFSRHQALVEHVACVAGTENLLHRAEQEEALESYVRNVLGVKKYRVVRQEQGMSPMTDYIFPRHTGGHIMTIGVPAGMLKPTTGYAFTRIQRDSAAIVRSLLNDGHPFAVRTSAYGYRMYDSLMLRLMAGHGEGSGSLLAFLFKYGSTQRILRFLDERGVPF